MAIPSLIFGKLNSRYSSSSMSSRLRWAFSIASSELGSRFIVKVDDFIDAAPVEGFIGGERAAEAVDKHVYLLALVLGKLLVNGRAVEVIAPDVAFQ